MEGILQLITAPLKHPFEDIIINIRLIQTSPPLLVNKIPILLILHHLSQTPLQLLLKRLERGLPQQPQVQINRPHQGKVQRTHQKLMAVCGQAHGRHQYLISEERKDYDKLEDSEGLSLRDQTGESRFLPLHFTGIVQVYDRTSYI